MLQNHDLGLSEQHFCPATIFCLASTIERVRFFLHPKTDTTPLHFWEQEINLRSHNWPPSAGSMQEKEEGSSTGA